MTRRTWWAGVVGGVVGGLGMGLVLFLGTDLLPHIGALYGFETVLGGWIAHLFNSVIFGLLFVAIVSVPTVRESTTTLAGYVGLGVGYGAALGILTGGLVLPLWLEAAGVRSVTIPFLPLPGFIDEFLAAVVLGIGHLVYGVLLGAVYGFTSGVVSDVDRAEASPQ